jgi:hypothetical protein
LCLGTTCVFRKISFFFRFFAALKVCWKFVANFQSNFQGGCKFDWNFQCKLSRLDCNFQCKLSRLDWKFNETCRVTLKLSMQTFIESCNPALEVCIESFSQTCNPPWKFDWKFATNLQQTFRAAKKLQKKTCFFLRNHVFLNKYKKFLKNGFQFDKKYIQILKTIVFAFNGMFFHATICFFNCRFHICY